MKRHPLLWSLIFLTVFIPAILATAYFALQLQRHAPPPPAGFPAADKGYGVTIDLTQYDDAALVDTLDSMHQNGLTWLRQPVSWAEIEPEPGQFNWQSLDRVIGQIYNSPHNFKIIAVLQTTPAWARPDNTTSTTPPSQFSDFGNFARTFAARYKQQIDYYQIWHEPNLSPSWGDTFVDAAAYADLLREAALNIRTTDPTSHILTAALAATLEDGPLNLNELAFLDQLYQAKANQWFDIVAIQPYGLWTKPLDAPDPGQLNFRRAELVRQVMLNHGDAGTPIWATAFGWVALPPDWAGRPSPWSNDLPEVQTPRTATAIRHARQNWPWLGPMITARWDSTGLDVDDPARGFALLETPSMLAVVQPAAANNTIATVGHYPANHPSGQYSPGWRFALSRSDIPQNKPRTLTIPFDGTRLDLNIDRGEFRGYLWVTIDGQPATALPQNGQGQSYVVLYDPLRESDTVTLARHLPAGRHEAVIEADGGWGQWAIRGWAVSTETDPRAAQAGLIISGILAVFSGAGFAWVIFRSRTPITKLAWAWSEILIALYAILGERGQIIVTFGLAAGVYLMPDMAGLALLPLLALAILLRPDLGLAVVTLATFFFQLPIRLPIGSFSPVELSLALTVIGFVFRGLVTLGRRKFASDETSPQSPTAPHPIGHQSPNLPITTPSTSLRTSLKSTDWAALTLVILALLSTLVAADSFAVSFREWRTIVVGSVVFYFLVRLGLDFNPAPQDSNHQLPHWAWRLINAFIVGATLQAIIALYLYFFTDRSIDAEGVHRALGLGYGSPNNLALVLDRAWPILLAITLLPSSLSALRRGLYGTGLLLVSLALYLTFSKGALLVGLPGCLVVMTLLYGIHHWQANRRRVVVAVIGASSLFALALIPFSQTERFRATFDFGEGSTAFFRLKLWQASWAMLQDHWPLGVGLDNFLYQYRTRYILPEAWQEPDLNHPHNLILDFGTRLGLGGIAVLLWLQIVFWRNAWHLYKAKFTPLTLGMMGSMVVFLSHGLVDNSYFLVDLAFAFFLIVGIVQRLTEE